MYNNIYSKITKFINRIVDIVSQGNLERVRILREFNAVFKEVYLTGELIRLCSVTTSAGDPNYKHELSTFYLRSGFKITIENDAHLTQNDIIDISKYVIESPAFVRQLMALGYDTLIIKGRNQMLGTQVSLKSIANLQNYMLT